ncbi:hypothetical protein FB45DRAFT_752350, partial [Roridomyces roridus]
IIHHSNLRPSIRFLFRTMNSGIQGFSFPELNWILHEKRRTVIFCKTIALSFRVTCYLLRKAQQLEWTNLLGRIRIYNSLNDATFNTQTLQLLDVAGVHSHVVVSTDALSVGWNPPHVLDVVIVGAIEDPDELIQKGGRVNREGDPGVQPRVIWYHNSKAFRMRQSSLRTVHL